MKLVGSMLLSVGFSGFAAAAAVTVVPEISPVSGVTAIALFSGALLVIRGRRKK